MKRFKRKNTLQMFVNRRNLYIIEMSKALSQQKVREEDSGQQKMKTENGNGSHFETTW
jgi:hypothetical protein